jgi:ubiquinone/menaquinone biosynthesis C-methylase UbiE
MAKESIKFDRAVEYYDATRGFPAGEERPIAAMIAQVGCFSASSRVLEIGVGTGRIALPLSPLTGGYYGIDISRPMMQRLKAKQNGEAVYVTEGDATRLPFPDSRFDSAVVVHVFHLIPGWRDALKELARVLRSGAPLIHCWTVDDDSFRKIWDAWNAAVPTRDRRVGMHWQKNPHFLEDEGWRPIGEPGTHRFKVIKTANKFLELVKKRNWSAMWNLSDAEMAQGLAAIEPLLKAAYPDGDAPIEEHSTFYGRGYLPPA